MTDASHNFYYVDLLHPPPKKTLHMLNILLNYLKFVNMVKAEIIEEANAKIAKLEHLKSLNNELELKNMNAIKQAKSINSNMAEFEKEMPNLVENCGRLELKVAQLNSEYTDHETKLKNIEHTITTLTIQEEKLKNEIVHDSEVRYLKK